MFELGVFLIGCAAVVVAVTFASDKAITYRRSRAWRDFSAAVAERPDTWLGSDQWP